MALAELRRRRACARERLDATELDLLGATFKMLGDPTRAGILTALSTGELCVCDLAELFSVTPSYNFV